MLCLLDLGHCAGQYYANRYQGTRIMILILGIGNILLRDEGAGIHALNRLHSLFPCRRDIRFVDGGTLSFTLAPEIEDATHLIVLDAAQLDAPPGAVRVFEDGSMDAFVGGHRKRSVHEVGLIDLMAIARLAGSLPQRRALIGIQPGDMTWGERPSPAVAEAIPAACDHAIRLIEEWSS
jgi:hydrogenase maturation protease